MRQCIGGNGADTTAAVMAWLMATPNPIIRHLYLIGEATDPQAIWLTDHEAPVVYGGWGTFQPAVISKGTISAKVGLDVQSTTVTWSPGNRSFTANAATTSPLQLARLHYYDNWPVRIWKCFMPTPGDANTLGACEWFGGRVGETTPSRAGIEFQVESFLSIVTQKVPANVIESTSTLAGYTAATIPPGDASIPTFEVFTGSTTIEIYANCLSPTANKIYSGNQFAGGYMVFLAGEGATLAGYWSAIGGNGKYTDGDSNSHSAFSIYSPLPWAPTPGVDTFYVSMAAPINQADGDFFGFPYVPAPTTAV
jgi:Uncharacterized conserved protein (DUF2163)